jgi:preprotein translocase SecE subunit
MKKLKDFFVGVASEMKKVRWLKGKEIIDYTRITLIFLLFFGTFFYLSNIVFAFVQSLFK